MGNYIVEDEVRKSYAPKVVKKQKVAKKTNYTVIGIGVLIVLILIIIIASRINTLDRYASLEKEMVNKTKDYIERIDYNQDKEIYIDVSKLNIDFPDDCSKVSGVFYKTDSYTPYLVCKEYESKKITSDNKISLIGDDIIFIGPGGKYYELGYSNYRNVNISGKVNTNQPGLYNVYYFLGNTNEISVRKVIVLDNFELINMFPTINTPGNEIDINIGESYNDKATAYDHIDGDLSYKIIKQNNVNVNEIGTYNSIYSVTNSFGFTTMKSQSVVVHDPLLEEETIIYSEVSNENMTNENVLINIKVEGGNYNYMVLPDSKTTTDTNIEYEVSENGTYNFVAINKDETEVRKTIKIVNIDKTPPTGTCKALLYSTKTSVTVTATSFNYIVGYNYNINNKDSGYLSNNYYLVNNNTEKDVYVSIKDYIGNESKIKCTTEKKYNYDPNGYRTIVTGKPRLHMAIGDALARKGYTISDLNKCIYDRVEEAGPGTRYGVVAAAYGLIDCTYKMTGYVLPYNHTSGKVEGANYCKFNSDICGKLGVNSIWGSKGGTCSKDKTIQCYHGMNCATFVGWAMCNGGMDMCSKRDAGAYGMASTKYFPEANGIYLKGTKVTYYSGKNLTNYSAAQLVRMIKPGDVLARTRINDTDGSTQHTFVVVGIDNEGIYTANDGYYIEKITYSYMLSGNMNFRILYLDDYYANAKNRNNLYN